MPREPLEVALPVRDEGDPEPAGTERLERRKRVLVEEEVLVPLPFADDLDRALPRALRVASHPANDLLREADPQVLVVDEIGMTLQRLDRSASGVVVERAVEGQPMSGADALVPRRPELGPRPEEREVDVEEDGSEHGARILAAPGTAASVRQRGAAGLRSLS